MQQIVFSGIQPTGIIHIGNYLGAIKNWIALQDEVDRAYFCIVDYHALSASGYDRQKIQETIYANLAYYLGLGLDPQKVVIFQQSDISYHTELAYILNNFVTFGELSRMTQFKEKGESKATANAGLFNYPVLMTADISLYKANIVPVGDDQIQHLELARDIIKRFNNRYGTILTLPEARVSAGARVMALNQPTKKMAKSLEGSYIALDDSEDLIRRKLKSAVSDSGSDGNGPGAKNLLLLLGEFAQNDIYQKHLAAVSNDDLSFSELKQDLSDALVEFLKPVQQKANNYLANKAELENILINGAKAAQPIAYDTLEEVRRALGLAPKRI